MVDFFKKPLATLITETAEMLLVGLLPVLLFHSKIAACFSAVPLVYAFFRFGKTRAFVITIFATLLTGFFESQTARILFLLSSPLPALIFCVVSQKQKSITPFFLTSIALLTLCYTAAGFYLSGGKPYPWLQNLLISGLRAIPSEMEKHKGVIENLKKTNPAQIEPWLSELRQISDNAPQIAQTFIQERLFGYTLGAFIVLLWIFVIALKFLGAPLISTDLTRWKVPDHLVWLAIASYLFRGMSVTILSPLSKNIFIVLEILYFLHGLSIVAFFFRSRQISSVQRNFFYAPFFLLPILTAALGFFDLWINFRSKIEKIQKKSVLNSNNVKGGV